MRKTGSRKAVVASIILWSLTACDASAGSSADASRPPRADGASLRAVSAPETGRHVVMDSIALGRPMPVLELMVPSGWRAESAVRWDNINGQCSRDIASPMFRLTSADGKASIEQFPGFLVTTSEQAIHGRGSMPGDFCVLGMADSGEAFARNVAIPFLRPQSRIEGMRQVPLEAAVTAITQTVQHAAAGGAMRVLPYQIEALLANDDGTREKIVLGGVILLGQQMMPGVPPVMINQNNVAYGVRARPDRMAEVEDLARRVRASIRPNQQWVAAVESIQSRLTKPVFPRPTGGGGAPSRGYGGGVAGGTGTGGAGGTGNGGVNGDGAQEKRIDGIYEQERCADGRVVSIHIGC